MKQKWKYWIPVIDLCVILISWLIIHFVVDGRQSVNDNILLIILNTIGKAIQIVWLNTLILSIVFFISLAGTILFYYLKKQDVYQGFKMALLFNLGIILLLYIWTLFQ